MGNLVSKQCRPWSDATLCGVWSGSALSAYDPFMGFQVRLWDKEVISPDAFNFFNKVGSGWSAHNWRITLQTSLPQNYCPDWTKIMCSNMWGVFLGFLQNMEVGWLVVLGLTALWHSISVYIGPKHGSTVIYLSTGTRKNNKISICSKWKINYFQVSQNLGTLQPNYNVLKYWDTKKPSSSIWDKWKSSDVKVSLYLNTSGYFRNFLKMQHRSKKWVFKNANNFNSYHKEVCRSSVLKAL